MSSIIQTYSSGALLLEGLHAFLLKGHALPPVYSGTGTGYIDDALGTASSVFEIITITFTSSTTFSVTGSVSGSLGTGSVGAAFSSAVFTGAVVAGATAFVSGDTITISMTAPWTSLIYATSSQYVWRAPGNDNNGGPTVGLSCTSNSISNYFNAQVVGYPTWQSSLAAGLQWKRWAGAYVPLGPAAGQSCTLYARADGRCCVFSCQIGSTFTTGIIGWMDAEHGIDQHPQPMIIGGSALTQVQWSDSSVRGPIYPIFPVQNGNPSNTVTGIASTFLHILKPNGRWVGLSGYTDYNIDPESYSFLGLSNSRAGTRFQANIDGSFPQLQIDLKSSGGFAARNPVYVEQGYWGKVPFLRAIPCYTSASELIGGGTIFRDSITRRRSVTLQNGYVVDGANTFAFELA